MGSAATADERRFAASGELNGRKLAQLRARHGISQARVAIDIGVTQSAIGQWERGEAQPTTRHLNALSYYFDCPLDQLVRR